MPIKFEALLKLGNRYWLGSYLYVRSYQNALRRILKAKRFFILDSGAHTFQKPDKEIDWNKYVWEYVQFLKQFPEIDEYVELDIENKVGLTQVEKWRKWMEQELGKPPIVVWHRERGKDYWLWMVKTYPYVGFSGFVVTPEGGKEVPEKYYAWFIKTAHEHGAKIHGFGIGSPNLVFKYNFDSVDSSTWVVQTNLNKVCYFSKGKIRCIKIAANKVNYRHRYYVNAQAYIALQGILETRGG